MDYRATSSTGVVSGLFFTQTQAEVFARKRARESGQSFVIERGRAVSINGETGWWTDLTFEPRWIFEEEPLKVAPV